MGNEGDNKNAVPSEGNAEKKRKNPPIIRCRVLHVYSQYARVAPVDNEEDGGGRFPAKPLIDPKYLNIRAGCVVMASRAPEGGYDVSGRIYFTADDGTLVG